MASEVADLFVILRAETAPFMAGMRGAAEEGESFTTRMGGVGGMMTKLGAATTAAGVAVAGVSVRMAGDFQASMLKLTTTAGESQANLNMVSEGVKRLAVETGTSTKQLADGMYLVESAGFHGADGLAVLKSAAEGARAEQAPLAEVSNAVTSALKSYHLPAEQATTVTNQMIAAVGAGKMTFSEFSSSLATVLPIASSAHVGFDQVGGAIATLTNHGTSAREATQELAFSIRALQAPNNVAVQEMQRLGLSSIDISTKLGQRGLTGTIDLLQQAVLQHMGPAGTVLLNTFNSSKQAAQDANAMIASMPTSLQDLARQFQAGQISMGDWRTTLKSLPVDQANLASQFATLINKSQGFNQQLKAGGPAEETFNASMKKMMGGATGLNTALMLGGENMVDFQRNVKTVGAAGQNAGKDIHGWEDITKTFNFQMSQLKERLEVAAITIGTKLIPVVLAVTNFFMQHKTASEALAVAIGVVLTGAVLMFIGKALTPFASGLSSLVGSFTSAEGTGRRLASGIASLASSGWDKVSNGASTAASAVRGLGAASWDKIKGAGLVVRDLASAGWSSIVSGATAVAGAVRTAAVASAQWVVSAAATTGQLIAQAAAWVAQKIAVLASAVAEGVLTAAQWLLDAALNANPISLIIIAFAALVAAVIYAWNHFDWFREAVLTSWRAIAGAAMWLWRSVFEPVWHGIAAGALWLWQSVIVPAWNGIVGTIAEAVGWISGLPGRIGSIFSSAGSWLWDAGKNIILGLWHGIQAMAGWVASKIGGLIKDVVPGPVLRVLGINSPSRVFAEIGTHVVAGLAQGIDTSAPQAANASRRMATAVAAAGAATLAFSANGGAGAPSMGALAPTAAAGGAPTYVVNVTVQGSVLSENDLRDTLEKQMYQLGMRNSTTWQPYARR